VRDAAPMDFSMESQEGAGGAVLAVSGDRDGDQATFAVARALAAELHDEPLAISADSPRWLATIAEERRAELVVVDGDRSQRSIESLLRQAPCPVVVVPREENGGRWDATGPVVCAVDGSAASDEAVAVADRLAERMRTTVVLAHAYSTFDVPVDAMAGVPTAPGRDHPELTGRVHGEEVVERAAERCRRPAEPRVERGAPAEVVNDVAERERASLVVVGETARGLIGRAILGHTWRRVVSSATRPVAIVREGAGGPSA
jgi:nucleotide-binding universal stress UspA family protein